MKNIQLAGCIIKDGQGKILLLHRNTPKRTQWEIPGGKIEENEDPFVAAERELLEELGIKVKVEKELGSKSFVEDDYTMEYVWFSAVVKSGVPKVMEPHVHDDFRFFDVAALEGMTHELSPNTQNFLKELQAGRIEFMVS